MESSADFERLVEQHARVMSSAIRRVLGRRHETLVPDVEQEVRLALWKRLGRGKKIDHPVSYLYKAALTTALAVMKRQAPAERSLDDERMQEAHARDSEPQRGLLPAERSRLLEQLLGRLPEDQARALKGYLAGLNHREVAALYDWTESVARHRIYRGIEALKALAEGTVGHG